MKKLKLCLLVLTVVLLSVSLLGIASASEDVNEPVGVDSVSLDKTELTLTVGGSPETLTATVLPENATNKEVEWSSGDPGVATVEEGVVTPVAAGSTVVTVKTVDGAKTATCSVTVQEIVEEDENGEDGQLDQRWKEWKEVVPADKVWKVAFNIPILPESVNDKSVYVHSNKSKKVNIRIEFSDDNKTIIINPPEEGYNPGEKYILFVKNKVRSASGKVLTKPIKMMFSVKAVEPPGESIVIAGISADEATVGKVTVTTAGDTTLEAVQAGLTMEGRQLSWEQVDPRTYTVTIPGAARGQKYTFTVNKGFTVGSGVDVEVEWAQEQENVEVTGISADEATVGKVTVTTADDTTLEAVQAGLTMEGRQLSWKQVDPRTYTVTIDGAARGQKYTFTINEGFTAGTGVDVEVEWAQETQPFTLTSAAFTAGQLIPVKYANTGIDGGQNVSVPLAWTGAPEGTVSLALLMYDLHPVANNWVHWAVINIPATAEAMPEGASGTEQMPSGSVELTNDFGAAGYGGPEPPAGTGDHEYKIVIYALNVDQIDLAGQVDLARFQAAVSGKSLGEAELTGVFFQ